MQSLGIKEGIKKMSDAEKMNDAEIVKTVKIIRRLLMEPHRFVWQAIAEGFIRRLERNGVTEKTLDRLGL